MKAVQPRLTYPELRMLRGLGERYELIDGELFLGGEKVSLDTDHLATEFSMAAAPGLKH